MNWQASDFALGDFVRPNRPLPAQTGKMTIKKLTRLIEAGYGQGHFQRYKPWLRVTKRDYSPNSNVGHLPNAALGRAHHYRARAERSSIHLFKWLGAVDVREAFPVWPWAHHHPGFGLPGFEASNRHEGLLKVAQDLEIPHGNYLGTSIPYVATLDILTTWELFDGSLKLIAIENKPEDLAKSPDPTSRVKERLQLTKAYCQQTDIKRILVHAEHFNREFILNLSHFDPRLTIQQQNDIRSSTEYLRLVELLNTEGYQTPISEVLNKMNLDCGSWLTKLWQYFDLAVWHQDIDHDISKPLKKWAPLEAGGRALRTALQNSIVGEVE
jgi:hypothetical protein